MGYTEAIDDANERRKRGEKQRRCPVCVLWIWESYYGPADWPTKALGGVRCIVGRHRS